MLVREGVDDVEERSGQPEIPAITSYDDAARTLPPPPPPPLAVPERKRMPRRAVAAIAAGAALIIVIAFVVPAWLVARDVYRVVSAAPAAVEPVPDESEILGDGEAVPGAEPDAEFLGVLKKQYPGWRFHSGELSEQKWSGGGMRQWHAVLESSRHAGVQLDVEYTQLLDAQHRPSDSWGSGDDYFMAGGTPPHAESLLDLFAKDIATRPVLIYSASADATTIGGGSAATYSVYWDDPATGNEGRTTYRLNANGGWSRVR